MSKPKILFYDIETAPYLAYVWQCGKQVVRHNQLKEGFDQPKIICVTYAWGEKGPVECIDWGYEEQDSKKVIQEFDQIIKQADMAIGKNSDRFDTKMINAVRMLNGLPGIPEWTKYKDDLEKQMRRYFRLPSQSLDYISKQFGLGGKIKMEFQDWVDILEKNKNGQKALNKMIKYGKKDTRDTRILWYKLAEHFDTIWNQATFDKVLIACKHIDCGSLELNLDGIRISGKIRYQQYRCRKCKRYAGRSTISPVQSKLGRLN